MGTFLPWQQHLRKGTNEMIHNGLADGRPSLFYPLISLKPLRVGSPNSRTHQNTLQGFHYGSEGVWSQWASTSSSNQSTGQLITMRLFKNVFTSMFFSAIFHLDRFLGIKHRSEFLLLHPSCWSFVDCNWGDATMEPGGGEGERRGEERERRTRGLIPNTGQIKCMTMTACL